MSGLEKTKELLSGASLLMPTPFKKNFGLDTDALKTNVEFMIEGGIREGIGHLRPTSSNGEYALMSQEEQKRAIQTVIDAANGRVPVVPATFHVRLDRTIALSKFAQDAGALAVMILPPSYFSEELYKVNREEAVVQYFKSIASEINIGLVIYNQPRRTGLDIDIPLLQRLADEIDNLVGVQECVNDVGRIVQEIRRLSSRLSICSCAGSGSEDMAAPYLLQGAHGFTSVIGCYAPQFSAQTYQLCKQGKYAEAVALSRKLDPVHNMHVKYPVIGTLKAAMNIVGRSRDGSPTGGYVRKPLRDLDSREVGEIQSALELSGII